MTCVHCPVCILPYYLLYSDSLHTVPLVPHPNSLYLPTNLETRRGHFYHHRIRPYPHLLLYAWALYGEPQIFLLIWSWHTVAPDLAWSKQEGSRFQGLPTGVWFWQWVQTFVFQGCHLGSVYGRSWPEISDQTQRPLFLEVFPRKELGENSSLHTDPHSHYV